MADSYLAAIQDIHYLRYMDDFLILSHKRWAIRRAQEYLYASFKLSGFRAHPDKTLVGKVEKGFDWLGVWFTHRGVQGVDPAIENHRYQCLRLEEQARRNGLSQSAMLACSVTCIGGVNGEASSPRNKKE